ncbi:hypothetical protein K402DRAFT_400610 [Aulographum hederae CBS 113979]|uniref:Uncharacterized protein n=1 Tax=Aulographum hederae CBS 113979 TaxID=1176131 RepID=A0A6G1HDJ7_9PEZI|nr:hypothetical protein K402DRAFT_400610 [Aulographum hederae CBS 113979]
MHVSLEAALVLVFSIPMLFFTILTWWDNRHARQRANVRSVFETNAAIFEAILLRHDHIWRPSVPPPLHTIAQRRQSIQAGPTMPQLVAPSPSAPLLLDVRRFHSIEPVPRALVGRTRSMTR